MATISRIPFCVSFSSSHCRKPFSYLHQQQQQQLFASDRNSGNKHGFICFACSIKRTRVRKKAKSDEELRSEILDFVALVGLPEGHVPSMKELSNHGRNDLANIVRRRGYKFIRELLANSKMEDHTELVSIKTANMEQSAGGVCGQDALAGESAQDVCEEDLPSSGFSSTERCIAASDGSTSLDWVNDDSEKGNLITVLTPRAEEQGSVGEDESSLTEVLSLQNFAPGLGDLMCLHLDNNSYSEGIKSNNLMTESVEFNNAVDDEISSEAPLSGNISADLDDGPNSWGKEDDNVSMTKDEEVNDVGKDSSSFTDVSIYEHYTAPDFNSSNHVEASAEALSALGSEEIISNEESFQNQQINDMAENHCGSLDHNLFLESDDKTQMFGDSSVTSSMEEKVTRFIRNGYLDTIDDNESRLSNESGPQETKEHQETHDPAKVQLTTIGHEHIEYKYGSQGNTSMVSNGRVLASEEVTCAAAVNGSDRDDSRRDGNADLDKDLHNETFRRENQVEINHLKFLLHQKEVELSRLKEQIEMEKLALSVLQRKAETEIDKAKKLVQEKDAELHEAEESLSGLQEVEIEYCGDGDVVEVTGSFNGWQHRVEMELQPSNGIGKQRRWSTLLWLYPGTYEIKFIVDGKWKIDPQKESVTRGHIINNILKVDR